MLSILKEPINEIGHGLGTNTAEEKKKDLHLVYTTSASLSVQIPYKE